MGPMAEPSFRLDSGAGTIAGWLGGDGDDLLLLHGGPGLSDYMDVLAEELSGWRTIRYQQRGLAPSAEDGPFTVERHVADALCVMDGLGVVRPVVLGHSWGGHLALRLAVEHPDRVRAVVVIDGLGVTGDGGAPALGQELRRRLPDAARGRCEELDTRLGSGEADDADALASLALLWPGYYADPARAPAMPAMRLSLACNMATTASVLTELSDGAFARSLEALTVPVTFILGETSPMPLEAGVSAAKRIPSSQVVVIPEAGHLPWYEQPGCVASALASLRGDT
jgi:pimeloyl-ACP methyl ester carboxylesterase